MTGPIADVSDRSLADLVSLAGRTAVVTGGAMGIGLAVVRRLAEAGADVVIADVDGEEAELAAKAAAEATGRRVVAADLDVADSASVDALVAGLGRVDIWVNNAGIYPAAPVLDTTDDQWDRVQAVNLRGPFVGSRAAGRVMVRQGSGVIVNVASTAGLTGGTGIAAYASSKHGVVGLTKALAVELGPYGVRVLAVAPTLVDTPGIARNFAQLDAAGIGAVIQGLAGRVPLRRAAVPDDVARVVLFCASDLSMLMTGSVLAVDAGTLAG